MKKLFENPVVSAIIYFITSFAAIYFVRLAVHKEFELGFSLVLAGISAAGGCCGAVQRNLRKDNQ